MSDPAWLKRYVGLPFRNRGAAFDGCNCWGLVHLVLKHEAGIETPTYGEVSAEEIARANAQFDIETSIGVTWRIASRPLKMFDVTLLRGKPLHVGVVIDPTRILHVWRATAAVIMSFDHERIRQNVIEHYRHRDLA